MYEINAAFRASKKVMKSLDRYIELNNVGKMHIYSSIIRPYNCLRKGVLFPGWNSDLEILLLMYFK